MSAQLPWRGTHRAAPLASPGETRSRPRPPSRACCSRLSRPPSRTPPARSPAAPTASTGPPGVDVPWDGITHVDYAFAHVGKDDRLSVGPDTAADPATGTTWPGVAGAETGPALPHQGRFTLFAKFKKQHPDVKTLIAVGGWAETGGCFDDGGNRVDPGGFPSTATHGDGSVNQAGIDTKESPAGSHPMRHAKNLGTR
ncbi:hypothetical protein GCM10019016_093120 [Streptomyces prasinosporus]|uniref:GH18 domain-containing protein n=1 Tax=Streptomyces prasinosporus TaxID=68256 RepID=A0ABP6U6D9_9ACTN